MSVALQAPFTGTKRLFDDADSEGQQHQQQEGAKRARCLGSPAGRCRPAAHNVPSHFQPSLPASAVAAVKALFPGMDAQVVENVLAECGQDIDAAIRRLNQLKLSTEQGGQQAPAQSDTATAPENTQQAHVQQAAAAAAAVPSGPQTAEQWIDALVQEMAAAKDMEDARSRAGKLLQAFEQFVTARNKAEAAPPGSAQARVEEVTRENTILKRAVQIQNAKLQEASTKDQEIAGLKQMLGQYQERLRQMELNNYSLALHLQKATNDRSQTCNRPPDVF